MVSYKGKEKTIPDYKIISALTKFALKGKPVKIKFDNEVYEIPPDVFIEASKELIKEKLFNCKKIDACMEHIIFDILTDDVWASDDTHKFALKVYLTQEEFEAVKDFFYYDPDVDSYIVNIVRNYMEIAKRLFQASERIKAILILCCHLGDLIVFFDEKQLFENYYYYKERIV